jgi:hypothetical protein
VKSGNIFAPRLCFNGKGTTLLLSFTLFLDKDFSTLIENGNSFQFSQAFNVSLETVNLPMPINQRNRFAHK